MEVAEAPEEDQPETIGIRTALMFTDKLMRHTGGYRDADEGYDLLVQYVQWLEKHRNSSLNQKKINDFLKRKCEYSGGGVNVLLRII